MPTINQAINSTRRLLANEVDNKLVVIRTSKDKANLWRGKKLIPTAQWEVLMKRKDYQYKLLDFIPEDYVEDPFIFPTNDEKLEEMRSAWYKDYEDFLEHKKSAAFGKYKCRWCILNPWGGYGNRDNLRMIILKGVKNCEFPCRTLNFFECPHGQNEKDSDLRLFSLRDVWQVISDALSHARSLSIFRDYTHEVDFEKDSVVTYSDIRLYGPHGWGYVRFLDHEKVSKIPVQSIKDIHYVLTNRKALDTILEQYIEYAEKLEKEGKKPDVFDSSTLKEMKKPIIDYIMELKNKIKIEELLNFDGKNLEEEKEERKKEEEIEKSHIENEPESVNLDRPRSAKCIQCGEFSNIHCINCNIWVCVEHWRKHAQDSHNMD